MTLDAEQVADIRRQADAANSTLLNGLPAVAIAKADLAAILEDVEGLDTGISAQRLERLWLHAESTFAPDHGCWLPDGRAATHITKAEVDQLLIAAERKRAAE